MTSILSYLPDINILVFIASCLILGRLIYYFYRLLLYYLNRE